MARRRDPAARLKAAMVNAVNIRVARRVIVRPICAPSARHFRPVSAAMASVRRDAVLKARGRIVVRKAVTETAVDLVLKGIVPKVAARMALSAGPKPVTVSVVDPAHARTENSATTVPVRREIAPKVAAQMAPIVARKLVTVNAAAPVRAKVVNSAIIAVVRREIVPKVAARMVLIVARKLAMASAGAPVRVKAVNSVAAPLSPAVTANLPAVPMIAAKVRRLEARKAAVKDALISAPGAGLIAPRVTPSRVIFTISTVS